MSSPEILRTPAEMSRWTRATRSRAASLGFVPTMGALHEGHRSLVERSVAECGATVVSIFVNKRQFNRADDFESYPRPIEEDLAECAAAGADAVYLPDHGTMYPPGFQTQVEPGPLAAVLEGAKRPGHFAGVTTVVAKLFAAVAPDRAYFGRKDFQQWKVIEAMNRDLDFGIEIVALPTVREADGLALSSRNRLLTPPMRSAAIAVPRALDAARQAWGAGERRPEELSAAVRRVLEAEPAARIDYVETVDPDTLGPASGSSAVVLVAAWFGDVRLIDNAELTG